MTAIDRVVIGSTFDALIAARKRISPDLEVSINLSGLDFEDDALVADISRLARAEGIRPSRITFEITETAALRDLGRVQDFTGALTSEGFKFALDDFGVGFSSFRYLRDLPMSTLKFDQSYVRDLPHKMENRVFVRGIAEICRGFGVKTVAEGVETAEILTILGSSASTGRRATTSATRRSSSRWRTRWVRPEAAASPSRGDRAPELQGPRPGRAPVRRGMTWRESAAASPP